MRVGPARLVGAEYKLRPGVGLSGMEFLTAMVRVMHFGYGFTPVILARGLVVLDVRSVFAETVSAGVRFCVCRRPYLRPLG